MKLNKKAYIPVILSVLMLTACGSSESSYASPSYASDSATAGVQSNGGGSMNKGFAASESYDDYDMEYAEAEESPAEAANPDRESNTSSSVISKEMLVYSCNMSIDVLDFAGAMDAFKSDMQLYGAFVESESYNDGGSSGHWYYNDKEHDKWQSYSATIRVPSSNYDDFCSQASGIGYLRSKNANVQNMSSEYYDLSTTLEIYEAKEKRYMDLLKTISDEEYAITVERELTDIEIEISKLKTRMNKIQTDVAYSYVNITINEVKEYVAEPVKTDTFFQRLSSTVSDATASFLEYAENILFIFIYLFPHLVIIGIIIFIIVKARKASKKRKAEKAAQNAPVYYPPVPDANILDKGNTADNANIPVNEEKKDN